MGRPEPTNASISTCCLSDEKSSSDVGAVGAVIPGGGEGVLADFATGVSACLTGALEGEALRGDLCSAVLALTLALVAAAAVAASASLFRRSLSSFSALIF